VGFCFLFLGGYVFILQLTLGEICNCCLNPFRWLCCTNMRIRHKIRI